MHCTKETVNDIEGKKAIFLLNHHYELDWLFSWMCADAYGVLGNNILLTYTLPLSLDSNFILL